MAEIKKFGKIYERDDGTLVYEGFSVDCRDDSRSPQDVLLDLISQRIRKDIQFEKLTPKEFETRVFEQKAPEVSGSSTTRI